jgi:Na+-transporting NADH:ubiquinone oxidoreductase subunit C
VASELDPTGGVAHRLGALPDESLAKSALVAAIVCLICSLLVATSVHLLRPRQRANLERERQRHILAIVQDLPGVADLFERADLGQLDSRVVDLETGEYAPSIDPATYDQREAATDEELSIELSRERDIARIQRRARYATVYLARREGRVELVLLPVHGSGYQSTLYGYIALASDGNTVMGLSFYEHSETPGIGAEVGDPDWLASWRGKKVRDDEGRLRIAVAKGPVDPASPSAPYEVDGISGATRTGDGVTRLLRFWLGEDGFGPYLEELQIREATN